MAWCMHARLIIMINQHAAPLREFCLWSLLRECGHTSSDTVAVDRRSMASPSAWSITLCKFVTLPVCVRACARWFLVMSDVMCMAITIEARLRGRDVYVDICTAHDHNHPDNTALRFACIQPCARPRSRPGRGWQSFDREAGQRPCRELAIVDPHSPEPSVAKIMPSFVVKDGSEAAQTAAAAQSCSRAMMARRGHGRAMIDQGGAAAPLPRLPRRNLHVRLSSI